MSVLNYYILLQGKDKGSLIRIGDGEFKYNKSTSRWEESDVMESFYAEHESYDHVNIWGRIHEFRKKITEEEAMEMIARMESEVAENKWKSKEIREELNTFIRQNGDTEWNETDEEQDFDDDDDFVELGMSFDLDDDDDEIYEIPRTKSVDYSPKTPIKPLDSLFWNDEEDEVEDVESYTPQLSPQEDALRPWENNETLISGFMQSDSQVSLADNLKTYQIYLKERFNPWFATVFYRQTTNKLSPLLAPVSEDLFAYETSANKKSVEELITNEASLSIGTNKECKTIIDNDFEEAKELYRKLNENNTDGFVAFAMANNGLMNVSDLARNIAQMMAAKSDSSNRVAKLTKIAETTESQYEKATVWLHDIVANTGLTPQELLAAGIPEKIVAAVLLLTEVETIDYEDYLQSIKNNELARSVKILLLKQQVNLSEYTDVTSADLEFQRRFVSELEYLLK